MEVLRIVALIVPLVVVASIILGWIIPLVIGIIHIRRGVGGVALTVIGGIWGLVALSLVGLGIAGYQQAVRFTQTEDFTPTDYEGPTGTIVVPYEGESQLVVRPRQGSKPNQRRQLSTTDGTLVAPAGRHVLDSYKAVARDDSNTEWNAECNFYSRRPREISVAANAPVYLEVGPPFTASVVVSRGRQDRMSFDLKLTGRGGDSYVIQKSRGGRGKPPGFEVLNKSGQIVWQGNFEYG